MKSILKYSGAKNRLANWIIKYIPEHHVYCEPVFFDELRHKISN